ncbi:MAG: PQQ-dependent sugar dehydrogenase [Gemmatimonadales bacterium]
MNALIALLAAAALPQCDMDNAGLTLPPGFCAQVVADGLGRARHMAVAPNGDVFVAVPGTPNEADRTGVWVLRDTNGDGRADVRERLIAVPNAYDVAVVVSGEQGWLYYSTTHSVVRHAWRPGQLTVGQAETVVSDLTDRRQHAPKTFELATDGMLYVNIGAPANSCQQQDRQPQSPGLDPCPLLAEAGGIWRFDGRRVGQTQADGQVFATGIRNMVALALHPTSGALYGVQHGRDMLAQNWGYSDSASANLPAEELFRIHAGDDFGWPYCYYDGLRRAKVLAPEYGGDGQTVGRCANKRGPLVAFPAHWAPNGLTFYAGTQFPAAFHGGAFVAFHGSWNRDPLPQEGFNLVFVPFGAEGTPGAWQVFAEGFRPDHRPVDVVVAPDGSLVVSDDRGGRIYRIQYRP